MEAISSIMPVQPLETENSVHFIWKKNEFEPADSENSKAKEQSLWKSHCRKYKRFQNLTGNVFKFCPSCSEFVVVGKLKQHADCGSIQQIHKEESHFPSKVLCPKSNPKCEAQYFFTDKSMEVLLKILEDLHTEKLLCIGTPRIHEVIRTKRHSVKSSLLLDIDERFCNFFSTNEFVLYNMFNHYFFCGTRGRDSYLNYLKGCENLLLLMDPPFGGRMELVSNTIQAVEEDWRKMNGFGDPKTLPVILIFPYFNEKTVKSHIPSMSMLDYQVDYDNHPLYTTGPKGLKRGSAVRMFTNLSPRLFSFPEGEGYSFCASCDRWVHPRNVHCFECGDCTSKVTITGKPPQF